MSVTTRNVTSHCTFSAHNSLSISICLCLPCHLLVLHSPYLINSTNHYAVFSILLSLPPCYAQTLSRSAQSMPHHLSNTRPGLHNVLPVIFGSSARALLQVTLLQPKGLRWLLFFAKLCSLELDDCDNLEFLVSVREISYCLRSLKTYTNRAFKKKYSHKLYFKFEPVPRSKHYPFQL